MICKEFIFSKNFLYQKRERNYKIKKVYNTLFLIFGICVSSLKIFLQFVKKIFL